ncbi:uncharacterized protein LOC101889506 [Musca domestica]|uniref:Uncharacterized protein LOC101889506 n=2 Tax=Musca domestica TaxID=7370 RepID=A0ABM3V489_MUSDO|nr:uncharacterized protein LOC131803381 [Musca domestica]XP_058980608.1 uncharacterized protein LOC101889506 [Musca domestica]
MNRKLRFWNARVLSYFVASLSGVAFLVAGILILLNRWQNKKGEMTDRSMLQAIFAIHIFSAVAFCLSLVFLKGLYQNRIALMRPYVYLLSACLLFAFITIICIYTADLVKEPAYFNAILFNFYYCLGLGLLILFLLPIFLVYRQMSKSIEIIEKLDEATVAEIKPTITTLY